ncbi:MAG: DUF3850 domain-containing protein [Agathobacter sp.]|uniref:DUF3850 domain-containing protein n=1 Tax=Agathobacter sp. TaxID=2021311 RepID=UPI002590079F|nr:DUF3850 domain-containing protein [Agathobacter sp.]MCR5678063.1 DUF3850 domain-containing protein [Agathobacter sp.]
MANREDLIKELYSNIIGEEKKPVEDERRYHSDTNSLTVGANLDSKVTSKRHEIGLEKEAYAEIMMGARNYFLTKDIGFMVGDVVAFRETSGFQLTGNDSLRTLAMVERNIEGIKDGYCIISWK